MEYHIAVDIGGTRIRAARFLSGSIEPEELQRIFTKHKQNTPLEQLIDLIQSVWPAKGEVKAIGIASPGPLDPFKGIVLYAPNIPGWKDIPLRALIEEKFKVPVSLGNDANLAALGEWKYGAGQGHHHAIYMTVSTGIGGGIVIDDRLLLGARGLGAELGHVSIMVNGPRCGCGQRGHLEALASGSAIAKWVKEQLANGRASAMKSTEPVTAKVVAQAAVMGDRLACEAMKRAGDFIGRALANYLHIFNPTVIIIGGGVSLSGDQIMNPIRDSLEKYVLTPHYLENLIVTTAALGDEAGLMGALIQARELAETQT